MCETKICSKCGVKKPLSDFYMNKNKPFSSCKVAYWSGKGDTIKPKHTRNLKNGMK